MMSKKLDRAKELRSGTCGSYNCAQATLIPTAEEMGLDAATAAKLTRNLGTGMKLGSTCGAVTGGLIALGLAGADDAKVAEYLNTMKERHGGSLNCPDLLRRNAEQAKMDKKAHCDGMIFESVQLVEELLAK
jgi:C_GCAxxG_C_C family probable redox protein